MSYFYIIFLKALILSSVLGCVDQILEVFFLLFLPSFLNGFTIYIFAVAELALFSSLGSFSSFCNADINPSGLRVNSIAVLSARNSLFLEFLFLE